MTITCKVLDNGCDKYGPSLTIHINAYDSNLDPYLSSFFLLAAPHGRPESKVTGHTLNVRMLVTPLGACNAF